MPWYTNPRRFGEHPSSQQQTPRKQRMKKPVDKAEAMWHNKPRCR
ncbi:hypothetical protein [Anaeroarcus burkinensis]|nr:hypothetical protein [Anaeroarcus burkinensis]